MDRVNRVSFTSIVENGFVLRGVPSALQHFFEKGLPMIIATSTPYQVAEPILAYFGLLHFFSGVRSSDEFSYGKPDPCMFLRAGTDAAGITHVRAPSSRLLEISRKQEMLWKKMGGVDMVDTRQHVDWNTANNLFDAEIKQPCSSAVTQQTATALSSRTPDTTQSLPVLPSNSGFDTSVECAAKPADLLPSIIRLIPKASLQLPQITRQEALEGFQNRECSSEEGKRKEIGNAPSTLSVAVFEDNHASIKRLSDLRLKLQHKSEHSDSREENNDQTTSILLSASSPSLSLILCGVLDPSFIRHHEGLKRDCDFVFSSWEDVH